MNGKTVFILGGDGFCGWPTSLRLSRLGYKVVILDNFSRRLIDLEINSNSLTDIKSLQRRIDTWNKLDTTPAPIVFEFIDLSKEFVRLCQLIQQYRPVCMVHLAEIKSAPYSMKDPEHANLTIQGNTATTSNILNAIVKVDPEIHLVHLGTMGVYGYGTFGEVTVPEGYIEVQYNGKSATIVHPYNPGSIYHMTKCLDNQLFHGYSKLYGLKITDLHQGIVWGFNTEETLMHPDLVNRLDYDSDYGTVLNRLLVQTAHGHPLTVYGSGEQTRAFINLTNSVDCIVLAVESDASPLRVRILNQMTECHSPIQLAGMLKNRFGIQIKLLDNPRREAHKNPLSVCNQQLLSMGLKPIRINEEILAEMVEFIKSQKGAINWDIMHPVTYWPGETKCGKGDASNTEGPPRY